MSTLVNTKTEHQLRRHQKEDRKGVIQHKVNN